MLINKGPSVTITKAFDPYLENLPSDRNFHSLIDTISAFTDIIFSEGYRRQRCKKGWSMGALLPEGNGKNLFWQKNLG